MEYYFDKTLYKERYTIERSSAWKYSFRSVLNRFDTTVSVWLGFNYLTFYLRAQIKSQDEFNNKNKNYAKKKLFLA